MTDRIEALEKERLRLVRLLNKAANEIVHLRAALLSIAAGLSPDPIATARAALSGEVGPEPLPYKVHLGATRKP